MCEFEPTEDIKMQADETMIGLFYNKNYRLEKDETTIETALVAHEHRVTCSRASR